MRNCQSRLERLTGPPLRIGPAPQERSRGRAKVHTDQTQPTTVFVVCGEQVDLRMLPGTQNEYESVTFDEDEQP